MAKKSLTSDIKYYKSKLDKEGYFILRLSSIKLDVKKLSKNLSKKIIESEFKNFPNDTLNKSKDLEEVINKLYNFDKMNNENNISYLYEMLNKFPSLYAFCYSGKIEKLFHKLGLNVLSLGTIPLIRIERPRIGKFLTPWHQDKWYSGDFSNSFVIWFPLSKSKDVGGIEIIPSSHKKGFYKFKKRNSYFNEQYQAIINTKKKSKKIYLKIGEAVVFNQFLLHKSLENNSKKNCRISCQIRFNTIKNTDPSKTSFEVKHSKNVKKLHRKLLIK